MGNYLRLHPPTHTQVHARNGTDWKNLLEICRAFTLTFSLSPLFELEHCPSISFPWLIFLHLVYTCGVLHGLVPVSAYLARKGRKE